MLCNSQALPQDQLCLGAPTRDLRWSLVNLLPSSEEGHQQDERLRGSLQALQLHSAWALQVGGLHAVQQLICCNNLITKVDLSDFYMHFLIGKADHRYMQFMWEGRKFECTSMPFSLAPALRLAAKIMAPVICYLQLCGL